MFAGGRRRGPAPGDPATGVRVMWCARWTQGTGWAWG